MKLLVVTHNLPLPRWGAGTRNYHLLNALARMHEVSLFATVDRCPIPTMLRCCAPPRATSSPACCPPAATSACARSARCYAAARTS